MAPQPRSTRETRAERRRRERSSSPTRSESEGTGNDGRTSYLTALQNMVGGSAGAAAPNQGAPSGGDVNMSDAPSPTANAQVPAPAAAPANVPVPAPAAAPANAQAPAAPAATTTQPASNAAPGQGTNGTEPDETQDDPNLNPATQRDAGYNRLSPELGAYN